MVCKHSNPPGYAFCAACGQSLSERRCACGFACAPMDRYCGRCSAELDANQPMHAGEPEGEGSGRYDLNLLQEVADRCTAAAGGPPTQVDQDDIARMLDDLKEAGR
ncbi:MAG: zinc ribbon domain-containing protein [Candidatus Tectomicrobia bacterium]